MGEGLENLLRESIGRLRAQKPELLVEFRQAYIGPRMRAYSNMLRSFDAPADLASNRIHVLDIRLLAGSTPVHSDMLLWHPAEPVASAALQLLHSLIAVPQISVPLDRLPAEHLAMLRYLLAFWLENRDVLLDGELEPVEPERFCPLVRARTTGKLLAAVYGANRLVVQPDDSPERLILVNGSYEPGLVVDLPVRAGRRRLRICECTGARVTEGRLRPGLHSLRMPPAGIAFLEG